MSFTSNAQSLRGMWKTYVVGLPTMANVTTILDNEEAEPPVNGSWVKLSIVPGSSSQASLGSPGHDRHRDLGQLIAALYEPYGKGEGALLARADEIRGALLANSQADAVQLRTPQLVKVGRAGKYWQMNVVCPWFADFRA